MRCGACLVGYTVRSSTSGERAMYEQKNSLFMGSLFLTIFLCFIIIITMQFIKFYRILKLQMMMSHLNKTFYEF